MEDLYAVGETACNGVHGRNRLASNSLLESLVFAKRAALDMITSKETIGTDKVTDDKFFEEFDMSAYEDEKALDTEYKRLINKKIEEANEASRIA